MIDLEQLKADREAGTDGPWLYRPDKFDDWGIVKNSKHYVICQARDPEICSAKELNEHRRAKTDPWGSYARRIARLPELEAAYIEVATKLDMAVEALQEKDNIAGAWPLSEGNEDSLGLLEMCGKVSVKTLALITAKSERDG